MNRKAISLFAGAGGMDLGVYQAGFNILVAIEKDPNCYLTLQVANQHCDNGSKIINTDIRDINPFELMKHLKLEQGELDLLVGGPPCQAFSQIGKKKGLEDERGILLFEMIRFTEAFRPKYVLIEQVKGLVNIKDQMGKKGGVFESFIRMFEELNYSISWQIINSADYGVPQLRKRIFIVANRINAKFLFPEKTHCDSDKITPLLPLERYVTVGDVLSDLSSPSPKGSERLDSHIDVTPLRDIERIEHVPEGSFLASQTHLPKDLRGRLTKKDTTKFRRLSYDKPSLTLRGGEAFYHPTENRYLTPRECMRLHGFPDSYIIRGPIRGRTGRVNNLDQHRQVANSVPPPVAYIIAKKIKEDLEFYAKDI